MAFATHDRPALLLFVTALAVLMKRFHQRKPVVGSFEGVTFGAQLILGGIILLQLSILIYVMTLVAFVNAGFLIVLVMLEERRGSLGILENSIVDDQHLVLGMDGSDDKYCGEDTRHDIQGLSSHCQFSFSSGTGPACLVSARAKRFRGQLALTSGIHYFSITS